MRPEGAEKVLSLATALSLSPRGPTGRFAGDLMLPQGRDARIRVAPEGLAAGAGLERYVSLAVAQPSRLLPGQLGTPLLLPKDCNKSTQTRLGQSGPGWG